MAKKYLDNIYNKYIQLPYVPDYADPVWHIFAVRCERRDDLEMYLNRHGIKTNKHYPIPIHLQEAYSTEGYKKGDFPVAEKLSETELSIPMYYGIPEQQVDYVIGLINNFK